MFDNFIELIGKFWDDISFFCIVDAWQQGVKFRNGVWIKDLAPGLHWKWPIIDSWIVDSVVTDTEILKPQALTTKDGKAVTLQALLKYNIRNFRKLTTEVQDREKALYDTASGVIADVVSKKNWNELNTQEFREEVLKAVRVRGFKYGIEVEEVQFPLLQQMRSYMIIQGNPQQDKKD